MGLQEIEKNYIEDIVNFFCKEGVMFLNKRKDYETGLKLQEFISRQIENRLVKTSIITNYRVMVELNGSVENIRNYRIAEVIGDYCDKPKSVITVDIQHNKAISLFYRIEYEII